MIHKLKISLISFFFCILFGVKPALALSSFVVPEIKSRVTDQAQILSSVTIQALEVFLTEVEKKTSRQVVVITLASLQGFSIEEAAVDIFKKIGIGQKGKDNGVLLLIVPDERKLRIEVGYGLEGDLTDVESSRIIRNVITPAFKQKEFNRGVTEGVHAIVASLESAGDGGLNSEEDLNSQITENIPLPILIILGFCLFSVLGLFTYIGIVSPDGWFLYFFMIPFWGIFPMVILPFKIYAFIFLIYLLGFPIVKRMISQRPEYKKAQDELKKFGRTKLYGWNIHSGGGSWGSARSGGWSSSSGGFGGGGFGGGGGRSGGGGASGGW